jgi:hypothetical protein
MSSTTNQRITLEMTIHECLEAGDDPQELKDQCAQWVDDWAEEQVEEPEP